jgi:hypothetical protein
MACSQFQVESGFTCPNCSLLGTIKWTYRFARRRPSITKYRSSRRSTGCPAFRKPRQAKAVQVPSTQVTIQANGQSDWILPCEDRRQRFVEWILENWRLYATGTLELQHSLSFGTTASVYCHALIHVVHYALNAVYHTVNILTRWWVWGFHGGDYEEWCLLRYKNPVRTSQGTNHVCLTERSRLMLCKIWGFHGGDYEECRLLEYKTLVHTSQETHYVSTRVQPVNAM